MIVNVQVGVVAVAVLSSRLGSTDTELTVAVFVSVAPNSAAFTWATSVIVAEPPTASDGKVTVRLLPLPPQTPPAVELHDTNVVSAGSVSDTVTPMASSGPLLVTVRV